jgi:hypothetical protein
VLRRQETRDLFAMLIDKVADAEHDLSPLRDRGRAPGGKGRGGGRHGSVNLFH